MVESAVVVLKARVTGTVALFAKRSPAAMSNLTAVAWEFNTPEATPADAVTSASVCTVMPVALSASAAAPIVKPLRVMVQAAFATMVPTAVVMTMEFPVMADVAVIRPVAPPMVLAALSDGLGEAAKNPAG